MSRTEALALKAEGLSVRQISVRLGVPRSTVGGWVVPRRACQECGAELCVRAYRDGITVCGDCWTTSELRRTAERAEQIAEWWAAGETGGQIAHRLGWSTDHLAVEFDRIRKRHPGLLPHRRTPEQRERMYQARWGERAAA